MIITQIESAIIERIKLVNSVANFGALLKTVDRYSGETTEENLDLLVTYAPFCLVSHWQSQQLEQSATGTQWLGTFTVICGATSRRAQVPGQSMASRVGGPTPTEIGSRQIAELVRDILDSQSLGLPISGLAPADINEGYAGHAGGGGGLHFFSITNATFRCKYSTARSTVADPAGVALTEIVAKWAPTFAGLAIDDPDNNTTSVPLAEPETGAAS